MNLRGVELTFCGHAAFAIKTPGGKRWIIDPWLEHNPACPERLKHPQDVDTILITHPHFDHIGDAVATAKANGATCVGIFETIAWLGKQGLEKVIPMNKGGTIEIDGTKVTMTHAVHSCGIQDGDDIIYGGEAAGYVLTFDNGVKIYHAGDTCVFSDMKIVGELYKPDIALLPIGDLYTMDPLQGAYAIRLLGTKVVIPMHYGTFPALTGTPDALREHTRDIPGLRIVDLKPGERLSGELQRSSAI